MSVSIDCLKNLDVLYVEDDPMMGLLMGKVLGRRVRSLDLAEHGIDGIEKYRKRSFDLILTDIEMPVMNGIEMIQVLREEFNCRVPIIVISAYNDEEHYTPLADCYVFKPVNRDVLLGKMEELHLKFKSELQ